MTDRQIRERYARLTRWLIQKRWTITTMESATAGQIASLITDTEGSSAILKGAFVTYCNEAKILQGVPESVIRNYGVYSKETAHAMAVACRRAYQADIGVGVTGSMGNKDPHNADSIPGVLYYALDIREQVYETRIEMEPQPDRHAYKMKAAQAIVESLLSLLERV